MLINTIQIHIDVFSLNNKLKNKLEKNFLRQYHSVFLNTTKNMHLKQKPYAIWPFSIVFVQKRF